MATTDEKVIGKLNELVEINNDRIEGYEKAEKETNDNELKPIFKNMVEHSRKFKTELASEVKKLGGIPVEGTSVSGKLFRVWMDFKTAVTGRNRNTIINSCKTGEEAAWAFMKTF